MKEILIGTISGIFSGIGMGGGTILIFLLNIFAGLEQHIAQATNFIYFVPTAISAIIINYKENIIDRKPILEKMLKKLEKCLENISSDVLLRLYKIHKTALPFRPSISYWYCHPDPDPVHSRFPNIRYHNGNHLPILHYNAG